MRNACVYIYKNTPITRRMTPHNRCAKTIYFIVILNCQFIEEPANIRLVGWAFFDRLPCVGALFRRYHNRCLKSAAAHWKQTSA